ncbi:MAG: hypothetical protein ACK4NY_00440 [Spirosomataceae bacterium]
MKKIIYSSILSLISVFAFGQSILLEPGATKRFAVKSTGSTYGNFSTTSAGGADLNFRLSESGDGSAGTVIGLLQTFSDRFQITANTGNSLTFFTNGNSERMRITSGGLVGVGIASPASNLHIHQPSAATTHFQISNLDAGTASTDGLRISYNNNSFLFPYQANIMNQESFGGLGLGTNNLIRFNIDYQGDIRVGSINSYAGSTKMMLEDNSSCCGTVRSTLSLLESELNDGPRLKFTNQNSTGDAFFWDIFGNPKASGSQASAEMNFYYSTGVGTGNNVLRLYGNGNSEHQGFTKLGSDAPSIKMKELTGTTNSVNGGAANIAHGLSQSKILAVSVLVNGSFGNDVPPNSTYSGFGYDFFVSPTNITINNISGNDANITNRPVKILITYKE